MRGNLHEYQESYRHGAARQQHGLVTKGPLALNAGAVVTSDVFSTIGAFGVDLINNGTWGAGNNFAGIGDLSLLPTTTEGSLGTMTFDLGVARNGVGADFSIYHDGLVVGLNHRSKRSGPAP